VVEVRFFASKKYEWIVEGDIKACFDEISHPALMARVLNDTTPDDVAVVERRW
jgi:retron-type reverse transcriptase